MTDRRSRGRPSPAPTDVAVGWYDAVQWAKLKLVAADADNLDNSYEDWKRNAESFERELRGKGIEILRVHINVDALIAWCQTRNKPIDGEARSQYAAQLAAGDKPS